MGPSCCPGDGKVHLDLGFFESPQARLGVPGDFAQACAVAHEAAHDVQNLLGVADRAEPVRRHASRVQANEVPVRVERLSDGLAGVWVHHARRGANGLERGDPEQAVRAAPRRASATTPCSAAARAACCPSRTRTAPVPVRWFRRGNPAGQAGRRDTLSAPARAP